MTRVLALASGVGLAALLVGCGPPTFNVGEPFTIVGTVPQAGLEASQAVEVGVQPQVLFNKVVDVASTGNGGITLSADGSIVDEVTPFATEGGGGKVIQLNVRRALPADTDVDLRVAGTVKSADGVKLDSELTVSFHTAP